MASGLTGIRVPDNALTPRDLAATLFRRPRLMVGSFALVVLAVMAFGLLSPRYESHFKVLLRRGRFDPVVSAAPPSGMDVTRPEITEEELNSEVELLRDEDLLRQVVVKAGLVPADNPSAAARASAIEHARRKIERRLDVSALKKSNLIEVTYKDTDPDRAARVLTNLSELYLDRHTSLQRPSGEIQFFDQQTADSARRLHRSEAELVNFTRLRGVVSAATERDIALQRLGEADAAYRQIDEDRVATEHTIASLKEQLKSFPSRSVTLKRWADNPQLQEKLKTHLLELELQRTNLLTRFVPSYRLVQEVDKQIEQTKAAIAAEALTPVRDETTDKDPNYEWARMELEKSEVQLNGLRARESDAFTQVASLRNTAQQMQSSSIDQQDLIRTAKADEDAYLLYVHKREEARISDALDRQRILNVAVIEPPLAPALPTHSVLLYFVLAFAISSVFSIGLGFAAEYFDSTLRTPDEAQQLLEVPVLAWLPAPEPATPHLRSFLAKGPRVVQ
ncbi:MAG: hypothetical protein WBQ72_02485 [Terriglobales bacterium]|jgi:uncharacterized protein involved in exopolysaccharide biosynthesis